MSKRVLKVCYLADASSVHTAKWVGYFARHGFDVHVISFEEGTIEGATLHRIKMPVMSRNRTFALKLFYIGQIKILLKQINPDIIHAFYVTNYGYFASKLNYHPFVLTAGGSDILPLPTENRLMGYVKKRIAENVFKSLGKPDLITTDAVHSANRMVKLGAEPDKIQIIQFGVDVEKFKPFTEKEQSLRANENPKIISLRNLYPVYNVETFVKAAKLVNADFPEARFIVIGNGSQKQKLEGLAERLGIKPFISFLGSVANDEMPHYLKTANIYVSTSLSDAGLSMSTAEAMACGLAVLITDVYDNIEWVDKEFLFKPKDASDLAKKICGLLGKSAKELALIGRRNRDRIVEFDNYEVEMAKMMKLYEKVIK